MIQHEQEILNEQVAHSQRVVVENEEEEPDMKPLSRYASEADYVAQNAERFWDRVQKSDGCWEWLGYVRPPGGYATLKFLGKDRQATHVMWRIVYGEWPAADAMLCHHCDNRRCVRPEHVYLGDAITNARDMTERGRHPEQQVTHCPRGHEYTKANTYITADGTRKCRPRGSKALTLRDVQMALVAQIRCKVCGKPRVVLNLAGWRRPMQLERVTPETHCACPPRVDADGSRHVGGPAWELVSVECEHCDHGEIVEMYDGYPEKSLCSSCEGLGRVPSSDASGYLMGPFARPEERV